MSKIYVVVEKEVFWWNTCCFSSNMRRCANIIKLHF